MSQRFFQRCPIGLAQSPFKRERGIVYEMDAVLFLQHGHTIPQVRLCPKDRPDEQEGQGHDSFPHLMHA